MSQDIFASIDPADSGTTLATLLNSFKDALVSGCSGTSRPTETQAGGGWIDTTNDPTSWAFKIYTGSTDITVFNIDLVNSVASVALAVDQFSVKKISADTNGAILELVKRRIATNGQVLDGDTVGEIQFIGRTDSSTNPVVAKIVYVASDNQTTSAYGGTLTFYATPDATASLTAHMRCINGVFETIVPHKLNSLQPVSQNVATAASIAALDATYVGVEMTGATATDIQGINAAQNSLVVTIHNRSTASVTLKHENTSASSANRLKLPNSVDYVIIAQGTATLYYCSTDTRWKLKSVGDRNLNLTVTTYRGVTNTFATPSTVSAVRVRAFQNKRGLVEQDSAVIDPYGNAFAWGLNANGQLGVGDVTPRSSPVAVLGGLTFSRVFTEWANTNAKSMYGISTAGISYAWGLNTSSRLGVAADVVPRSSPVAVLGSLKFTAIYPGTAVVALTTTGAAYAWGLNTNGQLSVGDVTLRSSPVAVLGGLTFASVANNSADMVALDKTGVAYAWGANANGQLGVGNVTPRSSPVAVLGSLTFAKVNCGLTSGLASYYTGLTTAGAAYAWGLNTNGNLGVGDTTPRSSPVAVLGGLTFADIINDPYGGGTVIGMTSTGALYAWGYNGQGQVGDGTIVDKSSPVAVLGGLTFVKVKINSGIAMGLTAAGALYAWGYNVHGELGVGDTTNRSSPVAVLGGLTFSDFTIVGDSGVSQWSILALRPDGTMYSWGGNGDGAIGDGSVTSRSSPVAVLGGIGSDARDNVFVADLTVTPSTNYTVTTGPGMCYFGATPLGTNVYKVEVEYL
jgi:alpha-tubulin suppressor-like RCC1 family protein